mgnify:CR=1 FL=1|jgi:holo-ACP synthase CitX
MNEILDAREQRSNHVKELISKYKYKTVVIMKANVPGINKNLMKMRFICNLYNTIIYDTFKEKIIDVGRIESLDGNYIYYVIDEEGTLVKEKTIILEEENALGRLIDIDVYNEKPISREDVSCEMRLCLICNNYAHICGRNKTHSEEEIFGVIDDTINNYLLDFILMKTIKSIFAEVDLYPKFGLVSRKDSGSHTDMDYQTFVKSTLAIKPYLREYILEGLKDELNPLLLQEIGQRAEKAMFRATDGVNTHKGLIFVLGLFLPVVTKSILLNKDKEYIKDEIKRISNVIIGDYYENMDIPASHGDEVYLKYGFKGVRGEALNGFSIVFDSPSFYNVDSVYRDIDYLISLMSELDDTTILYRKGRETLDKVKLDMKEILTNGGYTNNKNQVNEISNQYKKENISPGGSADLLVLKIMFEELRYLLCGDNKNGICL